MNRGMLFEVCVVIDIVVIIDFRDLGEDVFDGGRLDIELYLLLSIVGLLFL